MRASQKDASVFGFRDVGFFLRRQPSNRVQQDVCESRSGITLRSKKDMRIIAIKFGGRGTAISGSRPTMIVSL